MMKFLASLVGAATAVAAMASAAQGQWTFVDLHPPARTGSTVYSVSAAGGQQAGWTFDGPTIKAAAWSGTAGSWVDLHPPAAVSSQALGQNGGQQVGYMALRSSPGSERACIWSGTAASLVSLHPSGFASSVGYAGEGPLQVGYGHNGSNYRALMWSGTAASVVDLTPTGPGMNWALAVAIRDGQQGGQARAASGHLHACIWSGTAASFVDLTPGLVGGSIVWGVGSGQQVGITDTGSGQHAVMWSGTAASMVALDPFSTTESVAYSTTNGYQVGFVRNPSDNRAHASLWRGSAASWFDLHGVLPAGYDASAAYVISTDGVNIYIAGLASGPITGGNNHAVLWTKPLCNAPSYVEGRHSVVRDFSSTLNPSGVWSYGSKVAADPLGSFIPYTHHFDDGTVGGWTSQDQIGEPLPEVALNHSPNAVSDCCTHIDPGEFFTHPGTARDCVVRFTAPAAGTYRVGGALRGLSFSGTTSGAVLAYRGAAVFSGDVIGDLTVVPIPTQTLDLAAGESIDLIVTKGPNGTNTADSTGLTLRVDPCVTVATHPVPTAVCGPGNAAFSVVAESAYCGPLTYQWQRETTPGTWVSVANGLVAHDGGAITASDVTTSTLHLALNVPAGAPAVQLRCLVTNTCGEAISDAAGLVFCPVPGTERAITLANDAHLRVPSASTISPQQFTIETWFRPDGPGYGNTNLGSGAVLIAKPGEGLIGSGILSWGLFWNPLDGRVSFYLAHALYGAQDALTSINVVPQGTLAHCAATFDGITMRLYINGELDNQLVASSPAVYYDASWPVVIGAGNFGLGYNFRFQGLLDDVRIWNHARSAAQIASSFDCDFAGAQPGLLAAWNFDGSTLADVSGHSRNAVLETPQGGGFAYVAQPAPVHACVGVSPQKAISVSNRAHARAASASGISPPQFTLEAWFRGDGPGYGNSTDGGGAVLINKPREGTSGVFLASWGLHWLPNSGRVQFYVAHQFGISGTALTSNAVIPQGTLAHCAGTFDGTTLRLYINGELDSSVVAASPFVYYAADMPVLLGAGNFAFGYSRIFQGLLDEVRIWDHARTGAEIAASYDCSPAVAQPGLMAAWNFDGSTLSDFSGNGRNATAEQPNGSGFAFVGQPAAVHACSERGVVMRSPSSGACNNGTSLTITIDAATNASTIGGGQFFLGWDTTRLSLLTVTPGPGLSILYDSPNGAGRDIAVVVPNDGPTIGSQTMLTLTFAVSGPEACGLQSLVYFRPTDIPSRLTDSLGEDMGFPTISLGAITLDQNAPIFPPLSTLALNTDPGRCGTLQTLSLTAADVCSGAVSASASIAGNPVSFPYDFLPGTTVLTWTAIDACGNSSSSVQNVVVTDSEPPIISCPPGVTVNADAGVLTATLSAAQVGAPSASDNCAVAGVVPSVGGSPISFPRAFAQGPTEITWTATDIHGNSAACVQTVFVRPFSTMQATVELDGVSPGPFTRCITFELYRGGCPAVATVSGDAAFVGGVGVLTVDVPAGLPYTAMTATDPLHTLRRTSGPSNFGISGVIYAANFTAATGKKLIGGNFNNDAFIDILDFGGFIGRFGQTPGASTPCGYAPTFRHADFSADGIVAANDFNFISFSFLSFRDADPCGGLLLTGPGGQPTPGPLSAISIYDARLDALPGALRADVNHDGQIDPADIAIVLAHGVPTCAADFNSDGAATVQDIFDYLAAWFIAHPGADVNGMNGVTVQDIFDYLGTWFAGC